MEKKRGWNAKGWTKKLVLTALMTAIIALATSMASFRAGHGYLHFGDGVIMLSVSLLGPFGAAAAALGSAMADFLAGYPAYVPGTLVIKGCMALVALLFFRRGEGKTRMALLGMALAELMMVAGYFGYEALLYGVEGAVAGILPNILQGLFGVVVGIVMIRATRRLYHR